MMDKALRELPAQFDYTPVIANADRLVKKEAFLACGMGGSIKQHQLLSIVHPELDLLLHASYGLPVAPEGDFERRLVLITSYSGNTEESLDAYQEAKKRGLSLAVVATGGALIAAAKEDGVPYIELPNVGIQPRSAIGYTLRAALALMGHEDILQETSELVQLLNSQKAETQGEALSVRLQNRVPVIYSSEMNSAVSVVAKIKFNEGAKIPSYNNVFPELNHNEMQGFYVQPKTEALSGQLYFLFLTDTEDHPRIQKRMAVTKALYEERGLTVEELALSGTNRWHKIFATLLVIDWAAFYLAKYYGFDPELVEMVEAFKKHIA